MNKLIFNLLTAVIITVSFAPMAFAESGDQELIQQYDELVDKLVSNGFNIGTINIQSRIWLYNHGLVNIIKTDFLDFDTYNKDLTNHPELKNYINQKLKQIPESLLRRDMTDDQLISQYDELFDTLRKTGEDIKNGTDMWFGLLSLSGLNKEAHPELLKHVAQKLK